MTEKRLSSIKKLFGEHAGLIILCVLLMVGTFWSIAGSVIESDGAGFITLIFVVVACLGTCFFLFRSLGDGEKESNEERS